MTEAMEMCKSGENKPNPFVRCGQAAPEPICVLVTNHQLDEMVRNCTDNSNYVPIGVDPTFKLGHFNVTPILFPLKMLVHQSLKFSNYHYLASQVIGLHPSLKNTKAIGTDGKGPLYEAFCGGIPKATHTSEAFFTLPT